jgi:hypothetical protein
MTCTTPSSHGSSSPMMFTELDPTEEHVGPSPSWDLDLGGIGGVIHLRIYVADSVTMLYVEQSYSLSI